MPFIQVKYETGQKWVDVVGTPFNHEPSPTVQSPRLGHPGHSNVKNSRWKGGWIVKNGAVYVLQPDHPCADTSGYVREEIVVYESYCDRHLYSFERIKHRDGDKFNNYPDNLEQYIYKPWRRPRKVLPNKMSNKIRTPSRRTPLPREFLATQTTRDRRKFYYIEVATYCPKCFMLAWQTVTQHPGMSGFGTIDWERMCSNCGGIERDYQGVMEEGVFFRMGYACYKNPEKCFDNTDTGSIVKDEYQTTPETVKEASSAEDDPDPAL